MKKKKPAARPATPELGWLETAAVRQAKGQARLHDRAARTDAEREELQRRNSLFTGLGRPLVIEDGYHPLE